LKESDRGIILSVFPVRQRCHNIRFTGWVLKFATAEFESGELTTLLPRLISSDRTQSWSISGYVFKWRFL